MSHRVCILHPGYHGQNTLFELPARDGQNHDHAHFSTIKAACSIITGNESTIWLSHSASSNTSLDIDSDSLLPAGEYFLHIPQRDGSDDTPYPIVPNFRAWKFPHDALPQLWQDASRLETNAVQPSNFYLGLVASESCRITANHLECEDAHIIPASEKLWFTSNMMGRYGQLSGRSGDTVADTWVNKMRLQVLAHRLWDNLQFSIVPRKINPESDEVAWYTQMMNEDDELQRDWHRKHLQPLQGRGCQLLYARFAYDIFPRLHAFLQGGQPRWLIVCLPDGTKSVRMHGVAECRDFTIGQGKGRSASPAKRARSATDGPADAFVSDRSWDLGTSTQSAESFCSASGSAESECADSAIAGIANYGVNRGKPCRYDYDVGNERGRKRFRT